MLATGFRRRPSLLGILVAEGWSSGLFAVWIFLTAGLFFSYVPTDALRDAAVFAIPFGIGIAFRAYRLNRLLAQGVEVQARLRAVEVTEFGTGEFRPTKSWQARYQFELDGRPYFKTTRSKKFWSPGVVHQPDAYEQYTKPASFVECAALLVDPAHPKRSIFLDPG